MSDILTYGRDPKVLLKSPFEILPAAGMGQSQKINALARLAIYVSVVFAYTQHSWTPLLIVAVGLIAMELLGAWEFVFASAPGIGYSTRGLPAELNALHNKRMSESPSNPAVPEVRDLKRMQQAVGEGWYPVPYVGSEKTRQFSTRPASQRVEEHDPLVNSFLDDPFSRKLIARVDPTKNIRPPPA